MAGSPGPHCRRPLPVAGCGGLAAAPRHPAAVCRASPEPTITATLSLCNSARVTGCSRNYTSRRRRPLEGGRTVSLLPEEQGQTFLGRPARWPPFPQVWWLEQTFPVHLLEGVGELVQLRLPHQRPPRGLHPCGPGRSRSQVAAGPSSVSPRLRVPSVRGGAPREGAASCGPERAPGAPFGGKAVPQQPPLRYLLVLPGSGANLPASAVRDAEGDGDGDRTVCSSTCPVAAPLPASCVKGCLLGPCPCPRVLGPCHRWPLLGSVLVPDVSHFEFPWLV